MKEDAKTPAFRMSTPPEMEHYDLWRDGRRCRIRCTALVCLVLAWGAMFLSSFLWILIPLSYEDCVVPIMGIGRLPGLPTEVPFLLTLGYFVLFFLFSTAPLAFAYSASIGVGRFYAGALFMGVCAACVYPLLLRISTRSVDDGVGICWGLYCVSFLLASSAFLLPVLYDRYFAQP